MNVEMTSEKMYKLILADCLTWEDSRLRQYAKDAKTVELLGLCDEDIADIYDLADTNMSNAEMCKSIIDGVDKWPTQVLFDYVLERLETELEEKTDEDIYGTYKNILDKDTPSLKPNTLVQLTPTMREHYVSAFTEHDFLNDEMIKTLFLGEIQNMPGHGIFVTGNGKVHYGYHIDAFEEVVGEDYVSG